MAAMMRQNRKQILTIAWLTTALLLALSLVIPAPGRAAGLVTAIVTDPLTGVALDGYDPVSYFTDTEPQQGVPDYEHQWGGVPWYFASAANRDVFKQHPEIYAPQYGGHCAMSLGRGYLSDGQPRIYVIEKMKLYLFYSAANREAFVMSVRPTLTKATAQWEILSKDLEGAGPEVADALAEPAPAQ